MKSASKAVISFNDFLYLQHRDNKKYIHYPNKWSFFGGEQKKNESSKKCLSRELNEEISFDICKPILISKWFNSETEINITFFLIKTKKMIDFVVSEGQKGKWIKIDKLNKLDLAPDVQYINSLIKYQKFDI